MPQRTIAPGGGNWNSTATWVEGAVPTASDFVVGNASSGQLTINVSAAAQYIDLSTYANTITFNSILTLGLGSATSTFSSTTTITGSDTGGGITCNTTHTFVQNTTTRIPRLTLGAGTRTLLTDMYCKRFFVNGTTGLNNGFNIYIDTEFGNTTTTQRYNGGTTWHVIDGNASFSFTNTWGIANVRIDAPGKTISRTTGVITLGSVFEVLNGTIAYGGSSQGLMEMRGQSPCSLKITSGQEFNIVMYGTSGTFTFYDTTTPLNSLTIAPFSSCNVSSNTDLTIRELYLIQNFNAIGSLQFSTTNIFNIGEIVSVSPLDSARLGTFQYAIIRSDLPGTKAKFNYTGTTGGMNFYTQFIDINASFGKPITVLNGTITNSDNIRNISSTIPQTSYTFIS